MDTAGNQLDEKARRKIDQLRDQIKDCEELVGNVDEELSKWLIAQDYNADQAERMLRKSLEWRKIHKADALLDIWSPPPVLLNYFSFSHIGYDKFGCPIMFTAQGRTDMKAVLQCVTRRDYFRYMIWTLEKAKRQMFLDKKRNCLKITILADVQDLSIMRLTNKTVFDAELEKMTAMEANYPEVIRRVFVINAPRYAKVLFEMLKPFFRKSTLSRVRLYGPEKEEWLAALLEEIDADQLPAFLGGTMTDPDGDPNCRSKLNMGGEVPREYYLSNNVPVPKDGMVSVNINAGASGKKKLKFNIESNGSILRWEFMTEGGEIAFRVYHKSSDNNKVELVPMNKVESHLFIEEGQLICEFLGLYVMEFSNNFSILRSKKLHYNILVLPPTRSTSN